jgi:regulator of protease activity HflC (stomatin/prohibitin superfamily)
MKRIALLVGLLALGGCTHVELGHVGIEVQQCGGGGVTLVGTGYHATGACTSIVEYPAFVQTAVWSHNPNEGHPQDESITFTNKDQMQIAVDISLAYQLEREKVPAFYIKFRADDLDSWTHGFLRNLAREKFDTAAGKYPIEQIMGDNAAFLKEVREALQADVGQYGVSITQFGLVGAPRPPQAVIDSINAKATATQKALQIELELKQSEATARKTVAQAQGEADAMKIRADAQAYANQKLASSLSPVLVDYRRIEKWNGVLPQVQGGGSGMMLNVGSK